MNKNNSTLVKITETEHTKVNWLHLSGLHELTSMKNQSKITDRNYKTSFLIGITFHAHMLTKEKALKFSRKQLSQ